MAIVRTFPGVGFTHYLFDAGQNPTSGGASFTPETLSAPVLLSEAYGYRTALTVRLTTAEAFSDPAALDKHLSVPYTDNAKPRMFFAVFNGASSSFGHYSPQGPQIKTGNMPTHGAQRYLVMGRANGVIDPAQASNVGVFEIRIWGSALTPAQLAEQYAQLSATWRFSELA